MLLLLAWLKPHRSTFMTTKGLYNGVRAKMSRTVMLAMVLGVAMLGLQACFYGTSSPARNGQYTQYQSSHMVCDVNGNNCLACDASNTNCQSTARSSWGFFF